MCNFFSLTIGIREILRIREILFLAGLNERRLLSPQQPDAQPGWKNLQPKTQDLHEESWLCFSHICIPAQWLSFLSLFLWDHGRPSFTTSTRPSGIGGRESWMRVNHWRYFSSHGLSTLLHLILLPCFLPYEGLLVWGSLNSEKTLTSTLMYLTLH